MSQVRIDDKVWRWMTQIADVERPTSLLTTLSVTGNTSTSVSLSRTEGFYLQVGVNGAWGGFPGTVSISGLDPDANAASSELTFTANDQNRRDTGEEYLSVASVVTAGFTGSGSIFLRAVSRTGQPIDVNAARGTIKCAFTRSSFDLALNPVGNLPIESAQVFIPPNNGIKVGDILIYGGTRWQVKRLRKLYDSLRMRTMDKCDVFAEGQTL